MLNNGQPVWDPNYKSSSWVWGSRGVRHWELVIPIKYGKTSFGTMYTSILVYPDGTLTIDGQAPIQCASVEEAKEMGMTTYMLTKEGG